MKCVVVSAHLNIQTQFVKLAPYMRDIERSQARVAQFAAWPCLIDYFASSITKSPTVLLQPPRAGAGVKL